MDLSRHNETIRKYAEKVYHAVCTYPVVALAGTALMLSLVGIATSLVSQEHLPGESLDENPTSVTLEKVQTIEQPFVARNVKSALAVGKAQAVAILAAANRGISTYEYTPTQVKQRVANYGASSKEQIQEMVKLQLGLSQTPQPSDAADALAVAICHLHETHLSNLLAEQR